MTGGEVETKNVLIHVCVQEEGMELASVILASYLQMLKQ